MSQDRYDRKYEKDLARFCVRRSPGNMNDKRDGSVEKRFYDRTRGAKEIQNRVYSEIDTSEMTGGIYFTLE